MPPPSADVVMNEPRNEPRNAARLRFFLFGAVAVFALATSSLAACGGAQTPDAEKHHAFFVRAALAPPPRQVGASGCLYATGPDSATLFKGHADLGVADTYQLTLLLQASDPTTATSITGAHVVLTQGNKTLSDTESVANAFIPQGMDGLVSVGVFDPVTRDALNSALRTRRASTLVVANVELRGRNPSGGGDVTSPVFSFPIEVCSGCLVDFSQGNDYTASVQPNCLKPLPAGTLLPCYVGQDEPVACQLCIGSRDACNPETP